MSSPVIIITLTYTIVSSEIVSPVSENCSANFISGMTNVLGVY